MTEPTTGQVLAGLQATREKDQADRWTRLFKAAPWVLLGLFLLAPWVLVGPATWAGVR